MTIDHLAALVMAVGEPLPLLLLHATKPAAIPAHLQSLYKSTEALLDKTSAKSKKRLPKRQTEAA